MIDQNLKYYTSKSFDYPIFDKCKILVKRHKKQSDEKFIDSINAFDIETTNIVSRETSIMYHWQFGIYPDIVVTGRTWTEFKEFIDRISKTLKDKKIVIYVHNLSFEFTYLKSIFEFEEVFAMDRHKILRAKYKNIEFRCSYILTNMSLAVFTKKYKAKHIKLSGEDYEYDKERFADTPMNDEELEYCTNDVIGLVEALHNMFEADEDNIITCPLTSTGYVRRDMKQSYSKVDYKKRIEAHSSYQVYKYLREAFRGGNTHANRYYANEIMENVHSVDRASSYPDVLVNCEYPIKGFKPMLQPSKERVLDYLHNKHIPLLFRLTMSNVHLKDELWGCPYIAKAKCNISYHSVIDNGRILSSEKLQMTITDIDYKIIESEYSFDIDSIDFCYYSKYDRLPDEVTSVINNYFVKKTDLKGVEGQELFYMKSKNKLNGNYGMMAQDPMKQEYEFDGMNIVEGERLTEEDYDKYVKRGFLPYQWGVWCTAWARYRLEEGIRKAGHRFIYCDTDSVKYYGDPIDFTDWNNERIKDSTEHGAFAKDRKGKLHYMGTFDAEHDMKKFITMGAKKYADITIDDEFEVTVSGVNKKKAPGELGCIENFKSGFIFREAGGLQVKYNDDEVYHKEVYNGHEIEVTSNAYISDSTYTLGEAAEYQRIIEFSKEQIGYE